MAASSGHGGISDAATDDLLGALTGENRQVLWATLLELHDAGLLERLSLNVNDFSRVNLKSIMNRCSERLPTNDFDYFKTMMEMSRGERSDELLDDLSRSKFRQLFERYMVGVNQLADGDGVSKLTKSSACEIDLTPFERSIR